MIRRIGNGSSLFARCGAVVTAAALILFLASPGCNTLEGAGEDIEEAGEAVEDAAE